MIDMTAVFLISLALSSAMFVFICNKKNLFADKYITGLYKKREELKLKYALNPTEENNEKIKEIDRKIHIALHTDG